MLRLMERLADGRRQTRSARKASTALERPRLQRAASITARMKKRVQAQQR